MRPEPTRRNFLASSGAMLSLFGLGSLIPRVARASDSTKNLIVYWNAGGWDVSYVFDPHFESTVLARDPDSVSAEVGGLAFADAESRPSVRAFFEDYSSRTAFVNGIAIGSISHETCTRLMLTGSRTEAASDLPTLVAAARGGDLVLPHVVLSGPRFPGNYGHAMVSLSATLTGTANGTLPSGTDFSTASEERVRAYLARAADVESSPGFAPLMEQYRDSLERLAALEESAGDLYISAAASESQVLDAGLSALSNGLSQCLMMTGSLPERISWDSHMNNHLAQDESFEKLFGDLHSLLEKLETTPAPNGGVLADQTTVLVLSEMGRTPVLNAGDGKDHWPYTSAMVIGPSVSGGRIFGASDEYLVGRAIDPESGDAYDGGELLTPIHLMGAILRDFDADPGDWFDEPAVLGGLFGDG